MGSYVLALEQYDYGSGSTRLLWAMVNIPGGSTGLPQGYQTERGRFQAPLCGIASRYTYRLYALTQGPSIGTGVRGVTRTDWTGGQTLSLPSNVIGEASLSANAPR